MTTLESNYNIISDETTNNIELLDFGRYSQKLAELIKNSDPKFTVGIFGKWGTGKTTLMNMIMNELEKNNRIVTVWFDAWRYEKEDNLAVIPFLRTIDLRLEEVIKSKIGKWDIVKRGVIR